MLRQDGVIVRSSKKSKKEEVAVQKKAAYGNFVKARNVKLTLLTRNY